MVYRQLEALIGSFNLDANRVLDITLDVFAEHVVSHHAFFIDLLRASQWAPHQVALPENDQDTDEVIERLNARERSRAPDDLAYDTDTGSHAVANLMGHKFAESQRADAAAPSEKLYLAAAVLIWNGLLHWEHLWLRLAPEEDLWKEQGQRAYEGEMDRRLRDVGANNALASAAALPDDDEAQGASTSEGANKSAEAKEAQKEKEEQEKEKEAQERMPNQKLGLLRALLSIGDLRHACLIMAGQRWIVQLHTEIADLVLRLVECAVDPVMRALVGPTRELVSIVPNGRFAGNPPPKVPAATVTQALSGRVYNPDQSLRSYVFFFAHWRDRVPLASDVPEALHRLEKLLHLADIQCSRNMRLFSNICRLMRDDLTKTDVRKTRWLNVFRSRILPSLSLLDAHAPATIEVFRVLEMFDFEQRFTLYGEWRDRTYKNHPLLKIRHAQAIAEAKSVLRRLSSTNVKTLGKQLANATHTNPLPVFKIALNQVQSYDNLIAPVVETARYLTPLGCDTLAWSLLDSLASDRPRMKDDGTSLSLWLQSTAVFIGQIYGRWQSMAPTLPIMLRYVLQSVYKMGESRDLVVLAEIVARMANVEPFADLSDAQVKMLGGSPTLRKEVFDPTSLTKVMPDEIAKYARGTTRLAKALREAPEMARMLLLAIAVARERAPKKDVEHLKTLGSLLDQCSAALTQFNELLATVVWPDSDDLAAALPGVEWLLMSAKLEPAIAFDIARPKLRRAAAPAEAAPEPIAVDAVEAPATEAPPTVVPATEAPASEAREPGELTDDEKKKDGDEQDGDEVDVEMKDAEDVVMEDGAVVRQRAPYADARADKAAALERGPTGCHRRHVQGLACGCSRDHGRALLRHVLAALAVRARLSARELQGDDGRVCQAQSGSTR